MASKKPQSKVDVSDIPVQAGVDAESAYLQAQGAQSDKQWLDETSQSWVDRQAAEKTNEAKRSEGQAVVNLADATGDVGESTGASLIVADASESKDAVVAVKKKEDDSDDKGGYIWGGLGLLGLVGIAAAAGGGGGGGGSSPAPLRLDGLVIDDPVANAIVFRDVYGDGYLHVIEAGIDADGTRYIVDPAQAITTTNERGEFSNLGGSGRIISVGINNLPIKVSDGFDGAIWNEIRTATEGDLLFASQAKEDLNQAINNGDLAYLAGEDQVFDSLVVSSGLTVSVGGANVTLVTGVTSLVEAYLQREFIEEFMDNDDFALTNDDILSGIYAVAELFGYQLNEGSSQQEVMSFLLGGFDTAGINSPGNLNQEIYSVINAINTSIEALDYSDIDAEAQSIIFNSVLNSIISMQEARLSDSERDDDDSLTTFATSELHLARVVEIFVQVVNDAMETEFVDSLETQVFVDVALNHASFGGGAADIYETFTEIGDGNLVNMVIDGDQLTEDQVQRAGNITVLANGYYDDPNMVVLNLDDIELMGSNILVSSMGEDSAAMLMIEDAVNAPATQMSNGTLTYDPDSSDKAALGDISVKSSGFNSLAWLEMSGDLTINGDISVQSSGEDSIALALIGAQSVSDDPETLEYEGRFAATAVYDVQLYGLIDDNTNDELRFRIRIDGQVLEAQIAGGGIDDEHEAIADIVSQWNQLIANQYSTQLQGVEIEYWGDYARVRFNDTDEHTVTGLLLNGGSQNPIPFNVTEIQEGIPRTSEINFQGSHLQVIADGSSDFNYDNSNGEDFPYESALSVMGATGSIDGIDVIASNSGDTYDGYYQLVTPSYDLNLHAIAQVDLDGSVSGLINVETLEETYNKGANLILTSSAGELVLNDVEINVEADGYYTHANLLIGDPIDFDSNMNVDLLVLGEDVSNVSGSVNGVSVIASGYYSAADVDLQGDLTFSGNILVGTRGDTADADLVIESNFGSSDINSSSNVVFNGVNITVQAYGDLSDASFYADNSNAIGSINSINVEASSDRYSEAGQGAYAEFDLSFDGNVGNITISANDFEDEVEFDMGSQQDGKAATAFIELAELVSNTDWGTPGEPVTLTIGNQVLYATVSANLNGDFEILKDIIEQFSNIELNPQFGNLNVVLKHTDGDDDTGEEGLYVRWFNDGNLEELPVLTVDDSSLELDVYDGNDDGSPGTYISYDDSEILIEATANSTSVDVEINDTIGNLESLTINVAGDDVSMDVQIEHAGTMGDVTLILNGNDSSLDLSFDSMESRLVYNNSVIDFELNGYDSSIDFVSEGYATGTIASYNAEVVGYYGSYIHSEIGGDVEFEEIDLYSRNTNLSNTGVRNTLVLGNYDRDDSLNSEIYMDSADITVESVGYNAYSSLEMDDNDSNSIVTGTISNLNVYAGRYNPAYPSISSQLVSNADSDVSIDLHGAISNIDIVADHISEVSVDLYGDINVEGLSINIDNSNSSNVELSIDDAYGRISLIDLDSNNEGSDTDIYIQLDGSIAEVNLDTDTDANTYAEFELIGEQSTDVIDELNIRTRGTTDNANYTTVTEVEISQRVHGGTVNIIHDQNTSAGLLADTLLTYNSNFQAEAIDIDLKSATDGGHSFGLQINMQDEDHWNNFHNTSLEEHMTTVTGLTSVTASYANSQNNYIQFAQDVLEDADYRYDLNDAGSTTDGNLNISHFSNGLNGWQGGTAKHKDFEGSQSADDELLSSNGFYGSLNEFFDAATYGIASEYAFIDLNQYEAAGTYLQNNTFDGAVNFRGTDVRYDTWSTRVELLITYEDANGTTQYYNLDWDLGVFGNDDLGGTLLGSADVTVAGIVAGLNADKDWSQYDIGQLDADPDNLDPSEDEEVAFSTVDQNVQLFDNGGGILGIRIGEGFFKSVEFKSIYSNTDTTAFNGDGDPGDNYQDAPDWSKTDTFSEVKSFDIGEKDTAFFDANPIEFVNGGGYFFGMVRNTELTSGGNTWRGVLAMDEDGEGVTKLLELADVIATESAIRGYLADNSLDVNTTIGYDKFSSNYIGQASGFYDNNNGFDFYQTATNFIDESFLPPT